MKIRKGNILTGRYRYRHSWWTHKIILQVEYVAETTRQLMNPITLKGSYIMETQHTKWRDATLQDIDLGGSR